MKQQYYNINPLLTKECQINILIGERSNGKSYAVKYHALSNAWQSNLENTFGIIRRYSEDTKTNLIESYFADMPIDKITKGECDLISVYRGGIYFAKHTDDKIVRVRQCGTIFALALDERYKSTEYPNMNILIFEEFVTNNGYLRDEPSRLMQLMSTVFRRRNGRVFMVGNTISRVCPYTTEFGLKNLSKQAIATIDVYEFKDINGNTTRIAVEYCATTSSVTSGLFFGKFGKSIDGGAWQCNEYPHIEHDLNEYRTMYELSLQHGDFAFNMKLLSYDGAMCVYVYPATLKTFKRVLTEQFDNSMYVTPCLYARIRFEKLIALLWRQNKFVYCDNLTGEDFTQTIKAMKTNPFNLV